MVGEVPFHHPFSIAPLRFTITCPKVSFPTETATFWKAAATCPQKNLVWSTFGRGRPPYMITANECFVACVDPLLVYHRLRFDPLRTVYARIMQFVAHKQHPFLSKTRCWFRQLLVICRCLDKGGRGCWAVDGVPCQDALPEWPAVVADARG